MTGIFTQLIRTFAPTSLRTAVVAATLGIVPTAAFAEHRGFDHGNDRPGIHVDIDLNRSRPQPPIVVQDRASQVWVEPVYRTVTERQWIAPEYRTVADRVWCEPVVQTVTDHVWITEHFERRDVTRYERGRQIITQERVRVPGHYEDRPRQVVVTPGHYDDRQRQELVAEGHWQNVDRQECVTPGHWETRVDRVAVPARPIERHDARIDFRIPFGR